MLSFLKKLFGFGSTPAAEVAPYKVETPMIIALGEPPATVVFPVEGAGVVEVVVAPKKKAAPKKPAAAKPAAEKKPRAKKAPKA